MKLMSFVSDKIDNLFGNLFIDPIFIIVGLCILFIIIYLLLKFKLSKSSIDIEKKIVYKFDHVLYLLAQFDYLNSGKNDGINMLKSILDTGKSNYLDNKDLILTGLNDLKSRTNKVLVPESFLQELEADFKKLNSKKLSKKILKIIIIIVFVILLFLMICELFS